MTDLASDSVGFLDYCLKLQLARCLSFGPVITLHVRLLRIFIGNADVHLQRAGLWRLSDYGHAF